MVRHTVAETALTRTASLDPGPTPRHTPFHRADGRVQPAEPNLIREELAARLPAFAQPFLTWLTAKPANGERVPDRSAHYHLRTAVASAAVGAAFSVGSLDLGGWVLALLPIGLLLTASGMGKLQAVIYHHCAHRTVFGTKRRNAFAGELLSVVLLLQRNAAYRQGHLKHHAARTLLDADGEFVSFLKDRLGLRIGAPKGLLWLTVALSFLSPLFHLRFLTGRVTGCFLSGSAAWNRAAFVYWSALLVAVAVSGVWIEFAIAWMLPLVPLLQIGTALRVLCEHRIPDPDILARRDRAFTCHATSGVIAGEPAPRPRATRIGTAGAWLGWWGRILTVHLFSRVFVLVGDAPAHDYHHRHPGSNRWRNYIAARQEDAARGCPRYPVNYIETWGLFAAIDRTLGSLSRWRNMDAGAAGMSLSQVLQGERAAPVAQVTKS